MIDGNPYGADLCSVTVNAADFETDTGQWVRFTFDSGVELTSGTKYAICITPDGVLVGAGMYWRQDTNASYAYGDKYISSDSGDTWAVSATRDCTFRTVASGVVKDSFSTEHANQGFYDPYAIAQTFVAGSTYTITDVDLYAYKTQSTPAGTVTISIKAVFDGTVIDGYNENDSSQIGVVGTFLDIAQAAAQSFTAESTYLLRKIRLKLYKTDAGASGIIVGYIQPLAESGLPDADSEALDGTAFTLKYSDIPLNTPDWVDIYVTATDQIVEGNEYVLILLPNNADAVLWRDDLSDATYSGGTAFWAIDDWDGWQVLPGTDFMFELYADEEASLPEKPTNPTPADDATDVDFSDLTLSWEDGGGADTFDVYVGDVADNLTLISSAQADTSKTLTTTQRELFTGHCYWRIDATNDQGTTTGDVWDFVVAGPGKAKNPTPSDGQSGVYIKGVDRLRQLTWEAPDA